MSRIAIMKGFGDKKQSKIKTNNTKNRQKFKKEIILKAFTLHSTGRFDEAYKFYQQFIDEGFSDLRVFSNFGALSKQMGKINEAINLYKRAISAFPNDEISYSNLGSLFLDLGELQQAELYTRKALQINPDSAASNCNLGNILKDLSRVDKAEFYLKRSIEIQPNLSEAYFSLLSLYESTNQLIKLNNFINDHINNDVVKNEIFLFRARLYFRNKEYKKSKSIMQAISSDWINKSDGNRKSLYWNFLAFIEDKNRNYDNAFQYFRKSKLHFGYNKYDAESYNNKIQLYKNNIINSKNINKENTNFDDKNLVFLIGFPRSGTTLLDSILRSHPSVDVLEEKPLISILEKLIINKFDTGLDDIYSLSMNNILELRKTYFDLQNELLVSKKDLVIDKLPLHTISLPLINLLFPSCKIIFAHRHPYDTVLSCFQQAFKPNPAMANLVNLQLASRLYDQVMDAWEEYTNTLFLNTITSKYENLVHDFDSQMKDMIDFLDLDWSDNLRNFNLTAQNRIKISTPSSYQVIEPIYTSSIGKWRNYKKYFDGCHQYLSKWNSYFDYQV